MQRQQMSQGVDGNVNLRSLLPLGSIVAAAISTLRRALQRAAVDDRGCRIGGATLRHPQQFTQIMNHRFEYAGGNPPLCLLIDNLPWRQVVWHHSPGNTASHDVPQAIEHFTQIVLSLGASSRISVRYGTIKSHSASETSVG